MNRIKATLQRELSEAGWHSRGYLPHFDNGVIAQTITFRLANSLPQTVLARWKKELKTNSLDNANALLRKRIDYYLDQLRQLRFEGRTRCKIVQESLLHFDDQRYWLSAWVVMPNHVHLMLTPSQSWSISRIVKDMKSFTARGANTLLGRRGQFWMEDYFDRYVRDAKHFRNAIRYIENNPVKAKLCARPEDWPFSSAWFRASA